jgi:hypothetical protein
MNYSLIWHWKPLLLCLLLAACGGGGGGGGGGNGDATNNNQGGGDISSASGKVQAGYDLINSLDDGRQMLTEVKDIFDLLIPYLGIDNLFGTVTVDNNGNVTNYENAPQDRLIIKLVDFDLYEIQVTDYRLQQGTSNLEYMTYNLVWNNPETVGDGFDGDVRYELVFQGGSSFDSVIINGTSINTPDNQNLDLTDVHYYGYSYSESDSTGSSLDTETTVTGLIEDTIQGSQVDVNEYWKFDLISTGGRTGQSLVRRINSTVSYLNTSPVKFQNVGFYTQYMLDNGIFGVTDEDYWSQTGGAILANGNHAGDIRINTETFVSGNDRVEFILFEYAPDQGDVITLRTIDPRTGNHF